LRARQSCRRRLLFSPEAALLGETTVEKPFFTAEIDAVVAEQAKTTYPRDLQRMHCSQERAEQPLDDAPIIAIARQLVRYHHAPKAPPPALPNHRSAARPWLDTGIFGRTCARGGLGVRCARPHPGDRTAPDLVGLYCLRQWRGPLWRQPCAYRRSDTAA
jgi:hypothetical protein